MRQSNFSAFHRNRYSYKKSRDDSQIDFRFRNAEKWFDERKAEKTSDISSPVSKPVIVTPITRRSPPPGLSIHPYTIDELRIPSYDEFKYDDREEAVADSADLLPTNWQLIKMLENTKDIRLAGFTLPPDIEEGECIDDSIDLPINMYEVGCVALDALPFNDLQQRDFYMDVFCNYFNVLLHSSALFRI